MELSGQSHALETLLLGKIQYLGIGGWVGSRAGLDECGKFRSPTGFDPLTFEPEASRYTDYTNPANCGW